MMQISSHFLRADPWPLLFYLGHTRSTAYLLLSAALLSIAACKREPPEPTAAGYVLEKGTGKPIKNATVYGIDCDGELLGRISCWVTDSTKTDAAGRYELYTDNISVNARAPMYWKRDDVGVGSRTKLYTNIELAPYAWLKVTIKNESGAYAFYPPSEGSGKPPIILSKGDSMTFPIMLERGNTENVYIFTIREYPNNNTFPSLAYWNTVKAEFNHKPIEITIDIGAFIDYIPPGKDTSTLTITY